MWSRSECRRNAAVVAAVLGVIVAACSGADRPTGTHVVPASPSMGAAAENPNSAAGDEKGFINGWLDGETMSLRYTRLYFCEEPPESSVDTKCEVGAPATIAPRSGPIPKIYALAPAPGVTPDPATLHCKGGILCLNHPPMLDISRLGLTVASKPAHSHIIASRQAGWHNTVNIRVPTIEAWNELAAAKSLAKLRELQQAGRVGPDIPTNVYFFFEVQRQIER
jgi:hypothetical protein